MKNLISPLILSMFFLIFLNYRINAQNDSVSQSVIDYWNKVYEYNSDNNKNNLKKLSTTEIDSITKKYYKAISDDPVGFNRYLENQHKKWGDSLKKGYPVQNQKPGVLNGKIRNLIAEKYGKHFIQIISVPCYIKVKILKDTVLPYYDPKYPNDKNLQDNLTCQVEEVLKGEKYFHSGQQVTISFMLSWLTFDMQNRVAPNGDQHFILDKSYLIPIRFWDANDPTQYAVYCFSDAYFPIYPIENDIISIPGNYYNVGETLSWETFKNNFEQKYILK